MPSRDFATALVPDQQMIAFLWKPDGSEGQSITIRKEIKYNNDGKGDGLGDGAHYAVFHLYNYLDPTKAHTPTSGCRTNPMNEPYLDYETCLADAKRFEQEALASGQWVTVEQIQTK